MSRIASDGYLVLQDYRLRRTSKRPLLAPMQDAQNRQLSSNALDHDEGRGGHRHLASSLHDTCTTDCRMSFQEIDDSLNPGHHRSAAAGLTPEYHSSIPSRSSRAGSLTTTRTSLFQLALHLAPGNHSTPIRRLDTLEHLRAKPGLVLQFLPDRISRVPIHGYTGSRSRGRRPYRKIILNLQNRHG